MRGPPLHFLLMIGIQIMFKLNQSCGEVLTDLTISESGDGREHNGGPRRKLSERERYEDRVIMLSECISSKGGCRINKHFEHIHGITIYNCYVFPS